MMARPAADYLVHFGLQDRAEARNEIPSVDLCVDLLEEPPGDYPEAAVLAAREQGFAEGIASAGSEWEVKLAQERQVFEIRLATERENWAREEGEKLAEKIQAALAEIESNIARCVARILKPMVIEAMRAKVVDPLTVGVLQLAAFAARIETHEE